MTGGAARRLARALIAASVLLVVLAAAAPAPAFKEWQHSTAKGKAWCAVGCHAGQTPTNATCTNCHAGFTTRGGQRCWTCHEPGQPTSTWQLAPGCITTCHLWTTSSEEPSYTTTFTHRTTVHLGASGYGKTCVDCHGVSTGAAAPGSSPHHDAVDSPEPACADCHDGGIAAAPAGHDVYGTVCASCHTGMDRPSGDCAACHVGRTGTTIPQIAYTNTLACADVGCHGRVAVHAGTPVGSAPCTTCHAAHYTELGVCTACHPDPRSFHHGTAAARPLADCAGCHDDVIAAARVSHVVFACSWCHSDMSRPSEPAVCSQCHLSKRFGAAICTSCHSPSGMLGREQVHDATPSAGVSCTTCHTAHHADLGTCRTCHGLVPEAHHGVAALASSTLRVVAAPARLAAGGSAELRGSLANDGGTPLAAAQVLLQGRRLSQTAFDDVATLATDADGAFSRPVSPVAGTEYRVLYQGSSSPMVVQRPALVRVTVVVRQKVRLKMRPASVRRGAKVKFAGTVRPTARQLGAPASRVTLRVERKTASGWRNVARRILTPRAGGTFAWTWRTRKAGRYRARAVAAATPELLAGVSARVTVRVR